VLTSSIIGEAMTGRARPLTVVDLAVPRNVDPGVAALDGVRLVDLTELGEEAAEDPAVAGAVSEASRIVDLAASRYRRDRAAASAGPVIRALRDNVLQTCLDELGRQAGTADCDALEKAARAVAGKVLHRPTMLARAAAAAGDQETLRLLCEAFGVTVPDVGNRDPAAGSAPGAERAPGVSCADVAFKAEASAEVA
jgi:glutamyl-tRNA reductase